MKVNPFFFSLGTTEPTVYLKESNSIDGLFYILFMDKVKGYIQNTTLGWMWSDEQCHARFFRTLQEMFLRIDEETERWMKNS